MAILTKYDEIIAQLKHISANRPEIKTVILDDVGHVMVKEAFRRVKETGFAKFTDIGKHMFDIFDEVERMRDDITVIFMFHQSKEVIEGSEPEVKIKTIGKILDNWLNPEEAFEIVLYTTNTTTKDGTVYHFVTNRTTELPAKSPEDMFPLYMENDLQKVLEARNAYYNG